MLPFPEYAPDLSPFAQEESGTITNAFPRKDGYGPVSSPAVYSSALPAACRGTFNARNADGSVTVFAATSTRLWKLNNTDFTWVPVSKVSALTSISNASPAVFTLTSHGLAVGDAIVLSTSSALPTGLTVGTVYYVITAGFTANAFEVSTTLGGTAVNTSSAGGGTHSFTAQYTAVTSSDQWQFAQFNNFVFAVQVNVAPQVYDLTSSTAFADLGGSPPQARYVSIVGRFVVLSGMGSSTPYRIQWSGLNATTTWTSGTNSSDFQDFPDGGIVRGVAGSEFSATVFQDTALRRMTYVGGTLIFQFERLAQDKGIFAPLSIVRGGDRIFYCGNEGFQMIVPGGYPQPIGKERIDRTFFGDMDSSSLQLLIGAFDPKSTRIYWTYKSLAGSAARFDKVLVYDYALNKWGVVTGWSGEYISTLARPGLTLENLDSISSSIDALAFSLDDVANGALAAPALYDTAHKLNFLTGSYLEATLDTSEKEMDGARRARVQGFRPDTDASSCYGSIGARENMQSAVTYSTEQAVNGKGLCPANVSTRLARGRVRIPAAATWTFIQGVEPFFAQEGKR